MLAAYQGKEDLVRLLIDAGADVSYRVSEDPRSRCHEPQYRRTDRAEIGDWTRTHGNRGHAEESGSIQIGRPPAPSRRSDHDHKPDGRS